LVDSGTSLIVLSSDIWDDLMQELQKHLDSCRITETDGSLMMCQCPKDFNRIPALVINLINEDEKEVPLCMAPEEYILRTIDPASGKPNCVPSVQRGDPKQPVPLIFGMTFMRAFYTNFDTERHRIGFARSILSPMPANALCTVHNQLEKIVWISTTAFVALGAAFAIYTCCCGDINACCGWPSTQVTKPCCTHYTMTPKDDIAQISTASRNEDVNIASANDPKAVTFVENKARKAAADRRSVESFETPADLKEGARRIEPRQSARK